MKRIFVMNLGTTSFKFKLYFLQGETLTEQASGEIESVGAAQSRYRLTLPEDRSLSGTAQIPDHGAGFDFCMAALQSGGVLEDLSQLSAVGYKAVHGGKLTGTRIVDDALMAEMERVTPLAPAHNPIYLSAMRAIRRNHPDLLQIARFETAFHATIPDYRAAYGVPYSWREELGIRRYGFHGSSHEYIAGKVRDLQPDAQRILSCHLGGSSSLCAILDGKSVATTMGATLQTGLMQNNRVGDFEVCCLPLIMGQTGKSLEEVLKILSSESGILGLSGVSNDLRLVLQAAEEGNERARLTVDAYADNLVGYIGMFAAYLGGLDALAFTGGIGQKSALIRARVCEKLGFLGVSLDAEKNRGTEDGCISTGTVRVWRLHTDEEQIVARHICTLIP